MQYTVKAKRKDNNQWIEGYFFIDFENGLPYVMFKERQNNSNDFMVKSYEIDLKTICRYVGTLKIGRYFGEKYYEVTIYENDYISNKKYGGKTEGHVIYDFSSFKLKPNKNKCKSTNLQHIGEYDQFDIVGNIIDNPELLN